MTKSVRDRRGVRAQSGMNRRQFIKNSSLLAGGIAAGHALLPSLENAMAYAEIVPKEDPRLVRESVRYPGAAGEMRAYLAAPKGSGRLPGVLVVHENRGLNAHIEDVARRIASDGFLALAPDALSASGGTPPEQEQAIKLIGQLDAQANTKNFLAAVQYLRAHPRSGGKIGVVGFCWGGAVANQLAVHSPDVSAVVPYYGRQPAEEDVPKIKAALLLHYAGIDEAINKGIPSYEAALKKAGVDYRLHVYEGAKHAFNNDTNPERYNKEAADLAWGRTMAFFKEKLRS
ncbi:MAG: dienelactone hydrolase family protein [Deltaproteobacteria bacterium]|nr:dienelactone hydrolase family protein [Deltaproteobacteria bacterium]